MTRELTRPRREEMLRSVEALGSEALRTLGVAYRTLAHDALRGTPREHVEQSLVFLGLVG